MAATEDLEPVAAQRRRDTVELVIGWALLVGGAVAAITSLPMALLPGGFIVIDAPTAGEALRAGERSGAVAASLLLLAVAGVVLGLGVLRRGRAGLNVALTWVSFGVAGAAALSQRAWLLGFGALTALTVVLLALRRPSRYGAAPRP